MRKDTKRDMGKEELEVEVDIVEVEADKSLSRKPLLKKKVYLKNMTGHWIQFLNISSDVNVMRNCSCH